MSAKVASASVWFCFDPTWTTYWLGLDGAGAASAAATFVGFAGIAATGGLAGSTERSGDLHVTKNCRRYDFSAGSFCTITSSNLAEIKVGSNVFYDQAAGVPAGLLDSNVVLDAGHGNRAVGRCTLDLTTNLGLCTFSDGTGQFTGFQARVRVDCTSGTPQCRLDGTYSFGSRD